MVKIPKRKKSKDNPYTLIYNNQNNIYIVSFKDSNNISQNVEVTEEIFNLFNRFELDDISQMHEYERHIEHSELFEETLNNRIKDKPISLEERVENKIQAEEIKMLINSLSEVQRRRLKKYYFEDKTYEEIAIEENCSKVAVKYSIDIAIQKISEKIKK